MPPSSSSSSSPSSSSPLFPSFRKRTRIPFHPTGIILTVPALVVALVIISSSPTALCQTTQCNDNCTACGGYTPTAAASAGTWALAAGKWSLNVTFSVYYSGFGVMCQPNSTSLSRLSQFKIEWSRGSPILAYLNGTATTKSLDLYGNRNVVRLLGSGYYWWHAAPLPQRWFPCVHAKPVNKIFSFSCPSPTTIYTVDSVFGFKAGSPAPTCTTSKSVSYFCADITTSVSNRCAGKGNSTCFYTLGDTGCPAKNWTDVFITYRCSARQIPASDSIQTFCILAPTGQPSNRGPTSAMVLFIKTLLLEWYSVTSSTNCPNYKILYDVSYNFITKTGTTTRVQRGLNTTYLSVSFPSDGVCFWNVTAVLCQGTSQAYSYPSKWNFTISSPQPPNSPSQYYPADGKYQPENPPLLKWGMLSSPSCPAGFSLFWPNTSNPVYCYKFFNEPRTWSGANFSCHNYGIDVTLVTILSTEELAFMKSVLGGYNGTYWTGLNDRQREGRFAWIDGAYVTLPPPGGVKNNNDTYDCVYASTYSSDWVAENCWGPTTRPFICKQTGFNLNYPAYQSWNVYLGPAGATPSLIASSVKVPWFQTSIPLQEGTYTCISSCNVTLSWSQPASMGKSCPGSSGIFHVYLDNTLLSSTYNNSMNLTVGLGNHSWYVVANNSVRQTTTDTNMFYVCSSVPETSPVLTYPLTGEMFIVGDSLQWDPIDFGTNCLASISVLTLWYSTNTSTYNQSSAWIPLPLSNATSYTPTDLSIGTMYWALSARNSMLNPVSAIQVVNVCDYRKPSDPVLYPESPYETQLNNVTLSWNVTSCGEACVAVPFCNITVIFNGSVVQMEAPMTGSLNLTNLTAGVVWWYVLVNNGKSESVGIGSVTYTPPVPPVINSTVTVNTTVTINSTVSVNTTVPVNTTVTLNTTVPVNSTVSVNHTVMENATVTVNTTQTVNKTLAVNVTELRNVTHITIESHSVNCTENVTVYVHCSDGTNKTELCGSNSTITINCTIVTVTLENVTTTSNVTVQVNATVPTNTTIQVNKTITVNETVSVNVTVQVNQTVVVNTTVSVNQTVQVNTTVSQNQTVVVNNTQPVSCNCTPPDIPILSSPTNGASFIATQVTLEWGSAYKSFGSTCNTPNLKQFIVEWRQNSSVTWNSSTTYSKSFTTDFQPDSWWWHVIANNGVLNSTSEDRLFITCLTTAPSSPRNLSPIGVIQGTQPITLYWDPPLDWGISCSQAQLYSLIFNGVSVTIPSSTPKFTTTVTVGIINNVSVAACTMTKCSTKIFSTFSYCSPSELTQAPSLLKPNMDDIVENTALNFMWQAPPLGVTCDPSPGFIEFVVRYFKTSEVYLNMTFMLNTTSYIPMAFPNVQDEYQWSVRYFNGEKWTPSALGTFTTCVPQPPSSPSLEYPCDGCMLAYDTPLELSWSQYSCGITCPYNKPCLSVLYVYNGTVTFSALPSSTSYQILPSFKTESGVFVLSPGNWSWKISINNTEASVSTSPWSFNLCQASKPSAPTLLYPPLGAKFSQLLVNFSWNLPTFGKSCFSQDAWITLMLSKLYSDYSSATTLSGITSTTLTLDEGVYEWWMSSSNGDLNSDESAHFIFSICVPKAPGYPALEYPLEGEIVPLDAQIVISSLYDWGTECSNTTKRTYKLFVTEKTSEWPTIETAVIEHNGDMPLHLTFQTYNWTLDKTYYWRVRVTNEQPMQSTTDYMRFTACVSYSPIPPTLFFPVDVFNVSYATPIVFSWSTVSTWGHRCPSSGYSLSFQFVMMAEGNSSSWFVAFNSSVLADATSISTKVDSGTNYSWFLVMSNGWESVLTEIAYFGTNFDPCSKVPCKQGTCTSYSNSTVKCVCYPNWHGDACDIKDDTKGKKKSNMGLLGILAVPAVILPFIVGAAVLVLYRRKQQARLRLRYSNIRRLQFCQVKATYENEEFLLSCKDATCSTLIREAEEGSWITMKKIIQSTDITQLENLAKSSVYFFERHGKALDMMIFFITDEARTCRDTMALFRSNSFSTKAFKFYSKMVGLSYLFQTLGVLFEGILREAANAEEMHDVTSDAAIEMVQTNYEVDPEVMSEGVDESVNALAAKLICTKFILQITLSANHIPLSLRRICSVIQKEVSVTLPEFTQQSIGAFFFLRFINTAISVPEGYGLLPESPPENIRRQLIVITKILQNLANGVKFGDKEQFMMKFNDFLEDNSEKLQKFYVQLCDPHGGVVEKIEVPDEYYEPALMVITEALEKMKTPTSTTD
ncbi:succinate dehydrogenase [Pelomyxa schiedti]|nr:succinate dehydrogenase [Pelomyxa schiedti]